MEEVHNHDNRASVYYYPLLVCKRLTPLVSKLLAEYGLEKALFIIDFAHQAARETNYKLELFSGILEYTPRAMGVYEQLKMREIQQFSEERVRWLQEQYEEYRRQAIAQFRTTIPPDEIAAIDRFHRI